ncbi:hypothetical protein EMWEY_00008530 [Eimeria maxima]|uniref:SAG family member n=1 Tax=Eimeria maxima TaxID=5804 RepID=U6MER2_EIMMA|nr:hypothetical protein EMWEY_00008530 [Eimeria maxima]CDJ60959.1 hypothetical protein EMWEY_00008530 [Eimeria maxima]
MGFLKVLALLSASALFALDSSASISLQEQLGTGENVQPKIDAGGDAIVNEADVPKVDDLEKPEEAEDIQGSPLDVALLQEGELGAAGADSQSSSSSSTTTTTKATSTGTTAVTTTTTETTNVEVLRPSAASSSVANLTAAASAVILSFLYC